MKVTNRQALLDHLCNGNLSSIYLVINPSEYERREAAQHISKHLLNSRSSLQSKHLGSDQIREACALLGAPNLFGQQALITIDEVDRASKEDLERLGELVSKPLGFGALILCTSGGKAIASLCEKGKEVIFTLDQAKEKPWDRDKRLQAWAQELAALEDKRIDPDALAYLLALCAGEMQAIASEMEKLILYVGDEVRITIGAVQAIGPKRASLSGWKLSESIVWGGGKAEYASLTDLSELLGAVGQMRFQLHNGLKISSMAEQGHGAESIAAEISSLRANQVSKKLPVAMRLGSGYFSRGLKELYELEWRAKSGIVASASALLALFCGNLRKGARRG